jgi:hypothetical protein
MLTEKKRRGVIKKDDPLFSRLLVCRLRAFLRHAATDGLVCVAGNAARAAAREGGRGVAALRSRHHMQLMAPTVRCTC